MSFIFQNKLTLNPHSWLMGIFLYGFLSTQFVQGQTLPVEKIGVEQERQQQQRLEELQRQQQRAQQRVELQPESTKQPGKEFDLTAKESPCFVINQVELHANNRWEFTFVFERILKQARFTNGMCLGAQGIGYITKLAQNAIIDKGYITSRIVTPEQDLSTGKLVFDIFEGKVDQIRFASQNSKLVGANNKVFPISSGDILNIRDIEQGLENLKRVPTVEAQMQIEPSEQENNSDIVVSWQQKTPAVRVSSNMDNSGSKDTGKYQGGLTYSIDNLFGWSELMYFNYGHSLWGGENVTDPQSFERLKSNTRNYAFHFSVPYGYWLAEFNTNASGYKQAKASKDNAFVYSGSSGSSDIKLSRLIYRDSKRKTTLSLKAWSKYSNSYIDDSEIDAQRRKTGGWEFGLEHKEYFGATTVIGKLTFRHGAGWFGGIAAPEEDIDQGTSHMKITTLDLNINHPFKLGQQNWSYDGRFRAQFNQTNLINADKFSIGNRYSVRGFDGTNSLSSKRGWYLANDFIWSYLPTHQLYLGLDVGRVSELEFWQQQKKVLAGMTLGLKGQFSAFGSLNYEFFVSRALKQPSVWEHKSTVFGFNLNHSF